MSTFLRIRPTIRGRRLRFPFQRLQHFCLSGNFLWLRFIGATVDDRLIVQLASEVVPLIFNPNFTEMELVVALRVRVADSAAAAVWTTRADLAYAAEVVAPVFG